MSPIALPARHQAALRLPSCNRALVFDRGFDGFELEPGPPVKVSVPPGKKSSFLVDFSRRPAVDLTAFLARRRAALSALGARPVSLVNQSRLVVGLGLPSPLETGFLFDRLTGCPYLPGSSVKGLARATASLVLAGDLEGDAEPWRTHLARLFGPPIDGSHEPAQGTVTFYDAFPGEWPALEVDVLTPHYPDYYRDPRKPPADWQEPNPVPFLTVAAGTHFDFWLGPGGRRFREGDLELAEGALRLGLEALGLGGKKSAGYGWFGDSLPEGEATIPTAPAGATESPAESQATQPRDENRWDGAELSLRGSELIARSGQREARGRRDQIDGATFRALSQRKKVLADVAVERAERGWNIKRVEKGKPS